MLIPSATANLSNDLTGVGEDDAVRYVPKSDLTLGLRYFKMLNAAKAAIFPRHGGSLSLAFNMPLLSTGVYSPQAFMSGYLYFPGFTRSQGLKLSGVLQHHFLGKGEKLLLESIAALPRGYKVSKPTVDYAKVMMDYAIPVWLGDVSIPSVLYLKRMQLIPFADFAYDRDRDGNNRWYGSAGTDIMFHFHIFRLGAEIKAGIRYARLFTDDVPGKSKNFFGPLVGVGL